MLVFIAKHQKLLSTVSIILYRSSFLQIVTCRRLEDHVTMVECEASTKKGLWCLVVCDPKEHRLFGMCMRSYSEDLNWYIWGLLQCLGIL